jgi:LPXTG-motif cell wall-anchored protein
MIRTSKKFVSLSVAVVAGMSLFVGTPAHASVSVNTDVYSLCLPTKDSTTITVTGSAPGDNLVWVFERFTDVGTWSTELISNKFVDLGPAVDGDYTLTNAQAVALATQAGVTEWPFQIDLGVYTSTPYAGTDLPSDYDYVGVGIDDASSPYTECTAPVAPTPEATESALPATGRSSSEILTGVGASLLLGIVGLTLVIRRRKSRA